MHALFLMNFATPSCSGFCILLFERLSKVAQCKCNIQSMWCFLDILHWYCVFALRFEYLDGVGLFAMGSASFKPQNLQTMTLITQRKLIERSTDMVSWPKTSQIQARLTGFYMENVNGQRATSKHIHARRHPGVPAPVMIKRKPILHQSGRSEQFGAVVSVNQNQT